MKINNLIMLVISILLSSQLKAASVDTEDYYLCAHQVDGAWGEFGRIPKACDIEPFGSPEFVLDKLALSIFDDNLERTIESQRYMNNMNAIIIEAASYYLTSRKPNASVEEIAAWQHAIATVATVETFWSHYRMASDSRLKMVRGDLGHGHGMMQIDDRWHFTAIGEGVGWQLFENILYSFEIYYAAWQNAVGQSCLDSASDWRNRSRSAYSAYNGGPTVICRWNEQPDQWVQDTNYAKYYDNKAWLAEVNDPEFNSPLDIPCFLEGGTDCVPIEDNSAEADWYFQQLSLTSGKKCLFYGGNFHCVDMTQDVICLNALLDYVSRDSVLELNEAESTLYTSLNYERHQCLEDIVDSFKVADTIRSVQAIIVRTSPGGATTGVNTTMGNYYQILDLIASGQNNQHRYYKVQVGNIKGYIYAGDKDDYMDWATVAEHSSLEKIIIPNTGDKVNIVISEGLALKDSTTNNATLLKTIAKDTEVVIDSILVIGIDNSVYYQMTYEGVQGWAYGGHLLPEPTLSNWVTLVDVVEPLPPTVPPVLELKPESGGGGTIPMGMLILLLIIYYQKERQKKSPL